MFNLSHTWSTTFLLQHTIFYSLFSQRKKEKNELCFVWWNTTISLNYFNLETEYLFSRRTLLWSPIYFDCFFLSFSANRKQKSQERKQKAKHFSPAFLEMWKQKQQEQKYANSVRHFLIFFCPVNYSRAFILLFSFLNVLLFHVSCVCHLLPFCKK